MIHCDGAGERAITDEIADRVQRLTIKRRGGIPKWNSNEKTGGNTHVCIKKEMEDLQTEN